MYYFNETTIAVYRFIERYIQLNGEAPTVREIAEGVHMSNATPLSHLDKLKRAGYIEREHYYFRAIRIIKPLPDDVHTTEAIFRFIVRRISDGKAPSQFELARMFRVSEQTVRKHLKLLEKQGRIKRRKHVTRGIVLLWTGER